MINNNFELLLQNIANCRLCESALNHGVNPVVQLNPNARLLIAGQAPGLKVHQSSIPFNDKSGDRLRAWLGIDYDDFYDAEKVAILPMAFCYPGKGKSGDLPPRAECATTWHQQVLSALPNIKLIIAIGQYAQQYHLQGTEQSTLTETVKHWRQYMVQFNPQVFPIPHPSPRNNIWLAKNSWFEADIIPQLQTSVNHALSGKDNN